MPTYDSLRKLFQDLTLAALAAQSAACAAERGPIDRSEFDLATCEEGALVGVTPASPVAYLAIRSIGQTTSGAVPRIVDEAGIPCADASLIEVCEGALEDLPVDGGFSRSGPGWPEPPRQLIYTRGNEVGVVRTREELLAFLGTIENEKDAALVASLALAEDPSCDFGANARITEAGVEIITQVGTTCGPGTSLDEHLLLFASDGTVTLQRSVVVEVGNPNCVIGRLTDGLVLEPSSHADLGAHLAQMASLEAAAVHAFDRLARELAALGAKEALVARAYASADDERRHAREVAALAVRFGGSEASEADVPRLPLRDALTIALENAQEGCVRETYGALVATHQAEAAEDPSARATLARIARDETRHAALSFDVADFLDTRLSPAERREVARAREDAVLRFREALSETLPEASRRAIGLPDAETARALYASLERTVWAGTKTSHQLS